MDKMNTMKFNSARDKSVGYTIVDNAMYSVNKSTKSILLEVFDFATKKKHTVVNIKGNAPDDLLNMDNYSAITYFLDMYDNTKKWVTEDITIV
jgi:hypothetical protein